MPIVTIAQPLDGGSRTAAADARARGGGSGIGVRPETLCGSSRQPSDDASSCEAPAATLERVPGEEGGGAEQEIPGAPDEREGQRGRRIDAEEAAEHDVGALLNPQRRRHGAVLQHGSVLLGRSEAAPELPGLAELAGQTIDADELRGRWLARLAARLDLEFTPSTLTAAEREAAVELQRTKYSAAEWTYRR